MKPACRRVVLVVAIIGVFATSPARAFTLDSLMFGSGSTGSSVIVTAPANYDDAYQGGYDAGYPVGYDFGFGQGEQRGTKAGANAGDNDGYAAGWETTYSDAYDAAFTANYVPGIEAGYSTGLIDGFATGTWWAAEQDRIRSSAGIAFISNVDSYGSGNLVITGGGSGTGNGGGSSSGTLSMSGSALVDWNAHYYSLGFDDGKAAGTTAGEAAGYDAAYPIAYQAAYDAAFIVGGDEGFMTGSYEGASTGYWTGYDIGYDEGSPIGFDAGVLAYNQTKYTQSSSMVTSGSSSGGARTYTEATFTSISTVLASSEGGSPDSNPVPEPAAGILILLAAAGLRRPRAAT
jgi:hypothetical protein